MRLGELLLRQGVVTPTDVEDALVRQRVRGGMIGANLIALQRVTVEQLVGVLQDQRDVLTQLPRCEVALTRLEAALGRDHMNTARARYKLARPPLAAGNPAQALELARAALAAQKPALGPDHAWTQETEQVIAAAVRAEAPAPVG